MGRRIVTKYSASKQKVYGMKPYFWRSHRGGVPWMFHRRMVLPWDRLLALDATDADGFVTIDWRRAQALYADVRVDDERFDAHGNSFGCTKGNINSLHIPIPDTVVSECGLIVTKAVARRSRNERARKKKMKENVTKRLGSFADWWETSGNNTDVSQPNTTYDTTTLPDVPETSAHIRFIEETLL